MAPGDGRENGKGAINVEASPTKPNQTGAGISYTTTHKLVKPTGNHPPLPSSREPFRKLYYDSEGEEMLPKLEVNKRPKFFPRSRSTRELRRQKQIAVGPYFEELLEEEVSIDGGDECSRMVPCYGDRRPFRTFERCNFGPEVKENLKKKGWTIPTNIQRAIIPLIKLKRNDILANAPTGSGKTAAYLLPIIDELSGHKEDNRSYRHLERNKPYVVVMVPTKELAEQLYDDVKLLAEDCGVRAVRCYGDMQMAISKSDVAQGCDIFITTPGRLLHFVRDEIIALSNLRYMILDEADRLLARQWLDMIRHVLDVPNINPRYRILFFSATYTEAAMLLANELLRPNYFIVQVGGANKAVLSVKQKFIMLGRYEKQAYLLQLLLNTAKLTEREDGSKFYQVEKTLIFVAHKREANRLAVCLCLNGFSVVNINGDRTLQQRHEAISSFIRGLYSILVATDIAARGLNIPDVGHVINYDLPVVETELQSYVHRVGRTGRIGNVGLATSFFDPKVDSPHAKFYAMKLDEVGQRVPPFLDDIIKGTVEGTKLRTAIESPWAKFEAEERFLAKKQMPDSSAAMADEQDVWEDGSDIEDSEDCELHDCQF